MEDRELLLYIQQQEKKEDEEWVKDLIDLILEKKIIK